MTRNKRSLRVETLEDRKLFAVDAFLSGGDLVVNGSNGDDDVSVQRLLTGEHAGEYRVLGLNGTQVLGGGADNALYFDASDVVDDIRIYMHGGDDYVYTQNVNLQGSNSDLRIDLGSGNDMAVNYFADVRDDIIMYGRGGNDTMAVYHSDVDNDLFIYGGTGNDNISVRHSNFGDDIWIYTEDGADTVDLSYVDAGDWMRIHGGNGNDDIDLYDADARVGDFRGQGGSDSMSKINSDFDWINWTYADDDQWD